MKKWQMITPVLLALLILPSCIDQLKEGSNNPKNNTDTKEKIVELIYTKEEKATIETWKKASFDEMINDALIGNSAALYNIGMVNLLGLYGCTIDIEKANSYFSISASLGFGPALDKIRSMYIFDFPNPFLMIVYLNLTIASGHHEFIQTYHKLLNDLSDKFGVQVSYETEKIAAQKMKVIIKNKETIEKADNKTETLLNNKSFTNIVHEDSLYNSDYWYQFFEKK